MSSLQYRRAQEIGVSGMRISDVVAGRRAITAHTDLRLSRLFGLSDGRWLLAQAAHDSEVALKRLADGLKKIRPWTPA